MGVVIVGGGITGLACGLLIRARGIDTMIVDAPSPMPPASWGNAGHIAVEQVAPLASMDTLASVPRRLFMRGGPVGLPPRDIGTWLPFACRLARASVPARFAAGKTAMSSLLTRAIPAWRRLAAQAGAGEQIVEDGHFVVWESLRGARAGRAFWQHADLGAASVHELSRAEVKQLAGLLPTEPVDGLRFAGTARVRDPGLLCERLTRAFVEAGGEYRRARVARLQVDRSRVCLEDGERIDAATLLVAAGVGSRRLLQPLGIRAPLIAERGYHVQADAPAWPDIPPVVFEDRSVIVSRFTSGLRVAGFTEFAREQSAPDARKWERLRRHAAELQLPFVGPVGTWMGARPTLPDYLPAIGRSRHAGNLLYAFGHQHLGLTLAAITGELLAALACGESPELDLAPFALERF
jgi:glycine/D-amino acid oxidase-like deaminating enzyme